MKTYLTLPFLFVISLFTFRATAQNNNTDSSSITISKKVVGKDGKSFFIGSYKKDGQIREGEFQFFNSDGKVEVVGHYQNDNPCGNWAFYNNRGKIIKKIDFDAAFAVINQNKSQAEIKQTVSSNDSLKTKPELVVVEEMPTFNNGGPMAYNSYLQTNLHYPTYCQLLGIEGEVIVSFTVDKDGNVVDPSIIKGVNPDFDTEVLRLVLDSPKWKSGKSKGQPVKVRFTFPVIFKL